MRRILLLVATGAFLSPVSARAQSAPDSAKFVFARADSLYRAQNRAALQEALVQYRRAAELYRRAGDGLWQRESTTRVGWTFEGLEQRDSALAIYRQVHQLAVDAQDPNSQAAALSNIGLTMRNQARLDSAVYYFRLALGVPGQRPNPKGESATLNNLGLSYQDLGRLDSSLAIYTRSLRIKREIGDSAGMAIVLSNLGQAFDDIGHADSGVVYQREALEIRRVLKDRLGQSSSLNSLGILFRRLGQPDSSLVYLAEALALAQTLGNRGQQARVLNNVSNALKDQGRLDSALQVSKIALELRRAVKDRRGEGITANNIGEQYLLLGTFDSARVYMQIALGIAREIDNPDTEATGLNNLGIVFTKLGMSDSAETTLRSALTLFRAVRSLSGEAATLTSLADANRSRGRFATATAQFDSAAATWSAARSHAGSDVNRVSLTEQFREVFASWTLAWLARGARELPGSQAVYSALASSERGRAQALLALLRDSLSTDRPGDDLAAEGERLTRAAAGANGALLYYAVTQDTLLTFVARAGKLKVIRQPVAGDTLRVWVQDFRAALQVDAAMLTQREAALERGVVAPTVAGARRDATGARLARLLLPQAVLQQLGAAKEVLIVPQGALALVPFAALPTGPTGEPFGARYPLRYATSLATLQEVAGRDVARGTAGSLVVGDPEMPALATASGTRDRLASLPGAAAEARSIATRLGVDALTGSAASESAIRRKLPAAPIVHFATHGFAYSSDAKVRSSFVALAPDSSNDGVLSVGELLEDAGLRLSAELVVLSACQTGLGNLRQAEGTVGLQRAFLAKGARSVLVSLWSVSDAATEKLMTAFYRYWLGTADHPSKSQALRLAQQEVRRTPGFEHPRYWAAFQLVGAR